MTCFRGCLTRHENLQPGDKFSICSFGKLILFDSCIFSCKNDSRNFLLNIFQIIFLFFRSQFLGIRYSTTSVSTVSEWSDQNRDMKMFVDLIFANQKRQLRAREKWLLIFSFKIRLDL